MKIVNNTPFLVQTLPWKDVAGNPFLSIIVKGTFEIRSNERAPVAKEQIPIFFADEPYGEGKSIRFESDMAPFKPRADIVLVGHAHAPLGAPTDACFVFLRVGGLTRQLAVYGDRHWNFSSALLGITVSPPVPFTSMDLVYERAFGGMDPQSGDWCKENPLGRGLFTKQSKDTLNGALLPNIEDPDDIMQSWDHKPKPVGFGFYGRVWEPRFSYMGTYDEKWRKERSPDPPEDFLYDYYNGAHPDLQVEGYLAGDEDVELNNLTPDGNALFKLSGLRLSASVSRKKETSDEIVLEDPIQLNLDTLCFIPDEKRFYQLWRGPCPLRDISAVEVSEIEINGV